MIVYRVEHEQLGGPYRCFITSGYTREIHPNGFDRTRHHCPRYAPTDDEVFGFPTVAMLQIWFNAEERQRLHALGFQRSTYRVARPRLNVWTHTGQISFNWSAARLLKRVPLIKER